MRRLLVFCLAMAAMPCLAQVPGPADFNEGSTVTYDASSQTYSFSWWGRAGRTYAIQESDDLIHWNYVPVFESGTDAVIEWGFTSTSRHFFVRLRYSDAVAVAPNDFDGDGLSDMAEVQNGDDPFSFTTIASGFPNSWAASYGLEPGADASLGSSDQLSYTYDDADRLTNVTAPTTAAVGIVLDEEGNVTTINQ